MTQRISRRATLAGLAASSTYFAAGRSLAEETVTKLKGNIHHSVCKWCYKDQSLEELCAVAKEIGLESVELLGPEEWPVVQKLGLTCAMAAGPSGISDGWNRIADHSGLIERSEKRLAEIANAGLPNMIVFSGNRREMSDEEGLEHCAQGLKQIMALAEKLKVTVCMELLNSKVDHKDYQCDHTAWGVELAQRIGSERFKLLYDIYHMQIMEGDVVRTIRDNIQYIGHFHTGGVPGRAEIDDTQELHYPFIARAIVESGYKGFVGQEFIPKRDPIESLRQGVLLCDV